MDQEIRQKVNNGFKWSTFETFLSQILQFVISIVIARQLLPSDYGIIGMLAIFSALAQTFLDSGFGSALIRKPKIDDYDYATAFIFNVSVASVMYLAIFFAAPYIAEFYEQPLLVPVARISMLNLIISGAAIVQNAKLSRDLDFKSRSKITIFSLIASGIVGITLAYTGFGVWALVIQGLVSSLMTTILLWAFGQWRLRIAFSKSSFGYLFGFGSKHLASSLINTIYSNLATLIIGKVYNASDLGLYSRATTFATLPSTTVTSIVVRVNYPILSKFQDDKQKLLPTYESMLRAPMFILYPILLGIAVLAYPLVGVLLGSKWLGCCGLIAVLCLGRLFSPLSVINLNLLYVEGRTDMVLKLELMKKPIAFLLLLASVPFGVLGMCVSLSLYEFVAFCFNCYYTGKLLNYGFWKQIKALLPILGYSAFMAFVVLAVTFSLPNDILKLAIGIPAGAISYYFISRIFHDKTLMSLRSMIVGRIPCFGKILK